MDPLTGSETLGRISYENQGECFSLPFTTNDVEGNEVVAAKDKVSFLIVTNPAIQLVRKYINRTKSHDICKKEMCIFCGKKCKEKRNVFSIPSLAADLRKIVDLDSWP